MMDNNLTQVNKGFSKAFWTANIVELFERAAWYGVFVAMSLYLSRILSFNDIEAGVISGCLTAGLYLLPTFTGALADKTGYKSALMLAFGLLTIGYASMWFLPVMLEKAGLVEYGETVTYTGLKTSIFKWSIIPISIIIIIGGSFIKSVITGTIARETSEANRAKGYSIFYAMVNIGAFGGKTVVKPLRVSMGDSGFITLNLFAAGCTLLAFILVFMFYKSAKKEGEGKSLTEVWEAMVRVFSNFRLAILVLIVTGFWMVQHQLYASMPKYVLRMAGEDSSPSWYANVNPFVVVLTVSLVTHIMRKRSALFSMVIGMFIMPVSALCMALGNIVGDSPMMGLHPIAFMMIVGICFQALAESFISPRYLEYFSLQAPKGEEGLYLGFSHLHSFISAILGFGISGFLLTRYCPQRAEGQSMEEWALAKADAHYIWYFFVIVATISALSLLIYGYVTKRIDAKKAALETPEE